MKSPFILALFALGYLICATCATPTKQQDDDSATSKEELLKFLDHTAKSQQDGEGNNKLAKAEFNWGEIVKGIGNFAGGFLRNIVNPPQHQYRSYPPYGGGYYGGYESAKHQENVLETQQDDDNNDAKLIKELQTLIAKQYNDEDEDALAEDKEFDSNFVTTVEEDELPKSSSEDDDEDDEEDNDNANFQCRGRHRHHGHHYGSHRQGGRRRCDCGQGHRCDRGGGRGTRWGQILGNLFRGFFSGGYPQMHVLRGGVYRPMRGSYPPYPYMGGGYLPTGLNIGEVYQRRGIGGQYQPRQPNLGGAYKPSRPGAGEVPSKKDTQKGKKQPLSGPSATIARGK